MKKLIQNVDVKINVISKQIEIKFRVIVNTLFFVRSKYIKYFKQKIINLFFFKENQYINKKQIIF